MLNLVLGEDPIRWDESSTEYSTVDIYAFGTVEFTVELPSIT